MKITDEILAAYVDGTLPVDQMDEVRLYVASHPEELEQLVKLMDKYPQEADDDQTLQADSMPAGATLGAAGCAAIGAGMVGASLLASSGAAFVERMLCKRQQPRLCKVDIQANITNLLDEIM